MRLLNSGTWEFKEFLSHDVPPYAILSHTWGDEEVTFRDWQFESSSDVERMQGSLKIKYCCEQAMKDGLAWVWIDTCCIDKTSSAELSEAINSMFRWYKDATVCYVYLCDVSQPTPDSETTPGFSQSRWFTRGWTLQELLAPSSLVFYAKDWSCLGPKNDLLDAISAATGIETRFLLGEDLHLASISKRMSWAARRETSRIEDIAYCLLGIFDINMPLLYGEGKKAFQRLQGEIIKMYPEDHTIFAWGKAISPSKWSRQIGPQGKVPPWNKKTSELRLLGLLAESPLDFAGSSKFVPWHGTRNFYLRHCQSAVYPAIVGKGVRLALPFLRKGRLAKSVYHCHYPQFVQTRKSGAAMLLCGVESSPLPAIWIPLQPWGDEPWGRTREFFVEESTASITEHASRMRLVHVEAEQKVEAEHGNIIIGNIVMPTGYNRVNKYDARFIRWIFNGDIIRLRDDTHHANLDLIFPKPNQKYRVAIGMRRLKADDVSAPSKTLGPISISFWPVSEDDGEEMMSKKGVKWTPIVSYRKKKPMLKRTMKVPDDTWVIDVEHLPTVHIRVQRMPLEDASSFVDVVSVKIPKIEKPSTRWITGDEEKT